MAAVHRIGPGETVSAHEARQVPGVVDMSVREQYLVWDAPLQEWILPVELADASRALKHPTIDEHGAAVGFDQELGACDRVGSTEKRDRGHRRTVAVLSLDADPWRRWTSRRGGSAAYVEAWP